MPFSGSVYKITNIRTNKMYVGLTTISIERRLKQHIYNSKKKHQWKLGKAIKKYGANYFTIEEIENHEHQTRQNLMTILSEREIYWIDVLDTYRNGYNSSLGGEGCSGHICTEETRRKMSLSQTGRKHTKATRDKMSVSQTGKEISTQTKMNISNTLKKKYASGEITTWNTGKKWDNIKRRRPILQIDNEDNIVEFESTNAAVDATGIGRKAICNCLNGSSKTAGGFKWRKK